MRQQVNLYHPIFRKQQKRFSAKAMVQAGGLMMLGIAAIYAFLWVQIGALRGAVQEAQAQQELAARRLEDVARRFPVSSQGDEVSRLEAEIAARERLAALLQQGGIGNMHGFSDYFIAFSRQRISGLWLTAFDIEGAGEQVRLQGRATSDDLVPRFIQRLGTEKVLGGLEFQTFQMSEPAADDKPGTARYVEFTIGTGARPAPGTH